MAARRNGSPRRPVRTTRRSPRRRGLGAAAQVQRHVDLESFDVFARAAFVVDVGDVVNDVALEHLVELRQRVDLRADQRVDVRVRDQTVCRAVIFTRRPPSIRTRLEKSASSSPSRAPATGPVRSFGLSSWRRMLFSTNCVCTVTLCSACATSCRWTNQSRAPPAVAMTAAVAAANRRWRRVEGATDCAFPDSHLIGGQIARHDPQNPSWMTRKGAAERAPPTRALQLQVPSWLGPVREVGGEKGADDRSDRNRKRYEPAHLGCLLRAELG